MNRQLGLRTSEKGFGSVLNRVGTFLGRCALVAVLALPVGNAFAEDGEENYDRIEEDWELIVGTPNPDETSPQIINVISPVDTLNYEHAVLELNHSTQPDYADGGIQFQRWFGDFERVYRTPHTSLKLSTPNEKITYTMYMKIQDARLEFGVKNGLSQTWGAFGGNTDQWRSSVPSRFSHLNSYDPAISVKFSRVGYAANRVKKFELKQIRYYKDGELVRTDSQSRVISEILDEVTSTESETSGTSN